MTGTEFSTAVEEINGGDPIASTLRFQFGNLGKNLIEQRRPWIILRKTDTSKTVATSNTWQSSAGKIIPSRHIRQDSMPDRDFNIIDALNVLKCATSCKTVINTRNGSWNYDLCGTDDKGRPLTIRIAIDAFDNSVILVTGF